MILLYKPLGLTPLQAIEKLRSKDSNLSSETLSYAGRLDPMAEGLLLVLVGEENKKRREFEHLDKEYEFEVLVGIDTDSYDLLGIPKIGNVKKIETRKIQEFIKKCGKKISQKYPPYSSFKIEGKPLYWWTRRGKKVNIPEREIKVLGFEIMEESIVGARELFEVARYRVNLVKGNFRQEGIIKAWKKIITENKSLSFQVFKFRFKCSSGGYVRSLVSELGEFLGTGAVTFSIKRTIIDKFELPDAVFLS